ncbi:MAG TPA: sensor domain-containing protein [Streptosporangiaceae bacterium]|nr:sensor domain-containing protein [Streptosporangiaceae bacterium]
MGAIGPVNPDAAGGPPGRQPGGSPATLPAVIARTPFTARARRELLFCLIEVPLGLVLLALPAALSLEGVVLQLLSTGAAKPARGWLAIGSLLALLLIVGVGIPWAGRRLGVVHRDLAAGLLGRRIAGPSPRRRGHGIFGRPGAMLRDGAGWRAAAYALVKLPVTAAEAYAVALAALGLAALSYPFWWALFRNHPAGTHLQPVTVLTPFGGFGVATFPGTWAAFAAGAVMVLAAPWVARGAAAADCWLMRAMLGPGRLAQRVADLEESRALAVEDSAALLRRVERDLHDGAQIRLATLAMNLGMARERLENDADPELRELVDAAHQGAKDALADLRNLARGIHPPALDNGLPDALATLAAGSVIPVELTAETPQRPAPAIETIAYFCAAELLANAVKHSGANKISIELAGRGEVLVLRVSDDGVGGADQALGTGLAGLSQRVRTVDGQVHVVSPAGGPTQVAVTLPMHA